MSKKVEEQVVMCRTGHRSTSAVRMYKRPDSNIEKEVSDILQPPAPTPPPSKVAKVVSFESEEDEKIVSSQSTKFISKCTEVTGSFASLPCSEKNTSDSGADIVVNIRKGDKEIKISL